MSDQALVPITPTALAPIDVEVTAENADEMAQCQNSLIQWCRQKVSALQAEHTDVKGAYEHAVKCKWRNDTLKRQMDRAAKRLDFYSRVLTALEHGYQIVPSFPITAFAIRTDRQKPKHGTTQIWHYTHEQEAAGLPAGEGDYQNPFPLCLQQVIAPETPSAPAKKEYWAHAWEDLEFPITMAKPRIMQATSRAMALQIFDDLGICPAEPRADPMIIARIHLPKFHHWGTKRSISFIVAWHLNTKDL